MVVVVMVMMLVFFRHGFSRLAFSEMRRFPFPNGL